MKKIIFTILVFISYFVNAQDNAEVNNKVYKVNVSISESENRQLIGKVRQHSVVIDQPKIFGGDDKGPTPPEMMAISYGSCLASTIQFLAFQKQIKITDINIDVEGEIDFSKAMRIKTKKRAGYEALKAKISFKSDLSPKEKKEFIDDVFAIGAVIDNITNKTEIKYEIID